MLLVWRLLLSEEDEINPGLKPNSGQCFSIWHWDMDSVSFHNIKISLFTAFNQVHNFKSICITEPYLN